MKAAFARRWLLNYGVFFVVYVALQYFGFGPLGSIVHQWTHADGLTQNVLSWIIDVALVLAVGEMWRRIDGRIFGPWPRCGPVALGISLFSGLGDPAQYWSAFFVAAVSLAVGTWTQSSFNFFVTACGMALLVEFVPAAFERIRPQNGVAA